MINNTASRKTLAAVLAVGMAAGLTGCGQHSCCQYERLFY